jgi:hypothetical protein
VWRHRFPDPNLKIHLFWKTGNWNELTFAVFYGNTLRKQLAGKKMNFLNCAATFAIGQSASIACLVISVNELPVIDRVSHYATVFLLQWANKAVDRLILPSKLKSNRRNRLGCCVSVRCCSTLNIRRRVRHNAMILASVNRSFKALQLFFWFHGDRIKRSFANALKPNCVQTVPPIGQFDFF